MYKSCTKCGKIHSAQFKCNKNYKIKAEKTEEEELRSKAVWTKKSREIRERANNLCEVCFAAGRFVFNNLSVHHIIAIKKNKTKFLDDDNLICVCRACHTRAEKGELKKEYLQKLVAARDADTPPDLK